MISTSTGPKVIAPLLNVHFTLNSACVMILEHPEVDYAVIRCWHDFSFVYTFPTPPVLLSLPETRQTVCGPTSGRSTARVQYSYLNSTQERIMKTLNPLQLINIF